MNFRSKTSPYIRDHDATILNMMKHVIIALMPVVASALYVFKVEYLLVLLTALAAILLPELIESKIKKQSNPLLNGTATITAIIYSLTITMGTQLWIVLAGGLFAIIFAKMIFGGVGNNIFNPAAIGRVFILISFGGIMNNPADAVDSVSGATPLTFLNADTLESLNIIAMKDSYSIVDLLVGNSYGTYGEIFRIAILIGAVYLLFTKAADFRVMLSSIGMFIALTLMYQISNGLDGQYFIYQLLSGGFLFAAVFMITDPVTGPTTNPSRVVFGLLFGGLTFIIRIYGAFPEGAGFAILIMNMFAPVLDYSQWVSSQYTKGWKITIGAVIAIFSLIALFVA